MSDNCLTCGVMGEKYCEKHFGNTATIGRLERELAEAREALIASEGFRKAYAEGKYKMYTEGGKVCDAAMRHLPCSEGPLDRAAMAVIGRGVVAKADALDALAAWMQKPGAWVALWPDHIQVWRQDRKFGSDTDKGLATAIMDALEKAKQ